MAVRPDSASCWIVAIAASVLMTSSIWVYRCASILFIGVLEHMEVTREEAAWPLAAFSASSSIIGPVVGMLSRRFRVRNLLLFATCSNSVAMILSSFTTNIWQLTLTVGVMSGCSAGIPVALCGFYVTQYFDKYRTAALGVFLAGASMSTIVVPSVMQYCLDKYELSGTLLLFSGLCMQGIPASLVLFTIDRPEVRSPHTSATPAVIVQKNGPRFSGHECAPSTSKRQLSVLERKLSVLQVFKEKWFYIVGFLHITVVMDLTTVLNLMEDFGRDKNLDPVLARNLVGILAATDLLARLGSPWITDGGYVSREYLYMFNYAMMAVSQVLLALASNWIILICNIAFLGWIFGSTVVLMTNITRERLGLQNIPVANGWFLFFGGSLGLTRPKAIGYFRELQGSYNPIMYLLAGMTGSASVIYLLGYLFEREKPAPENRIIKEKSEVDCCLDPGRARSASPSPSLASV